MQDVVPLVIGVGHLMPILLAGEMRNIEVTGDAICINGYDPHRRSLERSGQGQIRRGGAFYKSTEIRQVLIPGSQAEGDLGFPHQSPPQYWHGPYGSPDDGR